MSSDDAWVLIDAGWRGDLGRIEAAVSELVAGAPVAILLTHDHPDHAGAARALAERWACRVFVHPAELAIARGSFAAMWRHAGPLDRYLILPAISALGRRRRDEMLRRESLDRVIDTLEADGAVPYLPDWRWVHTPGHTPGHGWATYDWALDGDELTLTLVQCLKQSGEGECPDVDVVREVTEHTYTFSGSDPSYRRPVGLVARPTRGGPLLVSEDARGCRPPDHYPTTRHAQRREPDLGDREGVPSDRLDTRVPRTAYSLPPIPGWRPPHQAWRSQPTKGVPCPGWSSPTGWSRSSVG